MSMRTIGILGGMGPLATADLFRKITLLTDAACDNEHIRVYIDSNARIPDRTAAILSGGPDPVPEMASALRSLERCGADCGVSVTGLAGPDGGRFPDGSLCRAIIRSIMRFSAACGRIARAFTRRRRLCGDSFFSRLSVVS